MSITLLQLVTAQQGEDESLLRLLRDWYERGDGAPSSPAEILALSEQEQPERLVVLSDWPGEILSEANAEAAGRLSVALSEIAVFEPALYRLRPLRVLGNLAAACRFVGASLTFAPDAMAETVEQVALTEGERLLAQPGALWTRRLRSISGPAVVFSYSGWTVREAFDEALRAVSEPVEDRIDLLGCKQVLFRLLPRWRLAGS